MINDDLKWLIGWFASQCDGDWEHEYGVRIGTLDNPGWRLRISLVGTELENHEFKKVTIERTETDWLFCFIDEGHFEAACGLYNLPEGLQIFRNWSESCNKGVRSYG